MLKLAYNTTDAPVTVDSAGFQIGGLSWGVVDTTDVRGKAELDSEVLRVVDEDKARASERPEVVAAVADLDRRRELADAAKAASKEELVEALPAETVAALEVGGDGQPSKADLEDAVISTGDAPESGKTAKKTATSRSAAK